MCTTTVPPETTRYACRVERPPGAAVVHLDGEIDLCASRHLWPLIDAAIHAHDVRQVEVDLSNATFLDAAAIEMLLTARRLVDDAGGELTITGASRFARRLFSILALDEQLRPTRAPLPR